MSGHDIVVIGAGYAGLRAARVAARKAPVTLVNASPDFVERVRLHQLAAGQPLRVRSLSRAVAGTGIELVIGTVRSLAPQRRELDVDGRILAYDKLIYALGSTSRAPEHAAPVDGHLRERVAGKRSATVVGAGLTGIETAAELAESGIRVRLVSSGRLGEDLSAKGAAHLRKVFTRLGVEVLAGVKVVAVEENAVVLDNGDVLDSELTVWATGFGVPRLAAEAGIAVDEHGRVLVDRTLRSVSHPDVYAAGDSALIQDKPLRMACATGLPAGSHVAHVVTGRPKPLRFRYFVRCLSLGRHDGLIQFVDANDNPRRTVLTGRTAATVKELIVRGAKLTAAG